MEYGDPGWWVPLLIFPGMGIIWIPLIIFCFIIIAYQWLRGNL